MEICRIKAILILSVFLVSCGGSAVDTATSETEPGELPLNLHSTSSSIEDTSRIRSQCSAVGNTLAQARQNYTRSCNLPRRDCDLIAKQWTCASYQLGLRAPVMQSSMDNTQQSSCQSSAPTLSEARIEYADKCSMPRRDCDLIDDRWVCSSTPIGANHPGSGTELRLGDKLRKSLERHANGQGLGAFMLPDSEEYSSIPQDPMNPITKEKVLLGQMLFHDTSFSLKGLSNNPGTWSCATCHHADAGFKAGIKQGIGEGGTGAGQNRFLAAGFDGLAEDGAHNKPDIQPLASPTILNSAYQDVMLWNGQFGNSPGSVNTSVPISILSTSGTPKEENARRLSGLETQAIAGTGVHRLDFSQAIVENRTNYRPLWEAAYGTDFTDTLLKAGMAIAAYERTVLANRSPFQRFLRNEKHAMGISELRGALLFFGKAGCIECHRGAALSSEFGTEAHNIFFSIGFSDFDTNDADIHGTVKQADSEGRGGFTKTEEEKYAFKIPQLYNLIQSNVFGHGASFSTVREVVEYKNRGVPQQSKALLHLDSRFQPLNLKQSEVDDLVNFIELSLYDPDLARYVPKQLPGNHCIVVDATPHQEDSC